MRFRISAASKLTFVVAVLAALAVAQPGWAGGNGNNASIPTLDGVGLATLGGAVAMAGAWLVARKRNRDQ